MRSRVGIVLLMAGSVGVAVAIPAPWTTSGDFCDCHLANGLGSPVLAALLMLSAVALFVTAATRGRWPLDGRGMFLIPLWCAGLWVIALWSAGFGDASSEVRTRWGFVALTLALASGGIGYAVVAPE
jgi:uncharacterized membrane protein